MACNRQEKVTKLISLPTRDDIDFDINERLIVEFYSK